MSVAIQFSGGKDSLACLYLWKGSLDQVTVYFGDTGDIYPHVTRFVQDTCERIGANLKVIRPKLLIGEYQQKYGLPADIIPLEVSNDMQQFRAERKGELLQPTLTCCNEMLWKPMYEAMIADGIRTVIRGAKKADGHRGVADGFTDRFGITYRNPIWEWSDDDVFAYLKDQGAELCDHYTKVNNSFDCLHCTGFLTSAGAKERLEYTRDNYPAEWPELQSRLRKVRGILDAERDAIAPALDMAEA